MKVETKSLKFNFIMNALLTMSQFIFPLITFPYVSRILSPEGIGKVSFATSVISYFAMFAQLGIPTYGVRTCAKVRDDKRELSRTVQELFIINIAMSIIAYAILFFLILFDLASISLFSLDMLLFTSFSASIKLFSASLYFLPHISFCIFEKYFITETGKSL